MATIATDGTLTWGTSAPARTTWGTDLIPVRDPGVPLSSLTFGKHNPLEVWKSQPSLRKVVGFIARNVASVPLHVYQRVDENDRRRAHDSPAERALREPSPFVTGSRLIHDIVVDWMLYDRWLVLKIDGVLRRVPGRLIDIKADFLGGVTAIRVSTPDGLVDVTDSALAFDSGWGDAGAGGVSPLQTLTNLLDEQSRAVKWRSEQWDQAARVTGVLKHPKVMQKQNRDRLLAMWREFTASKAGGTPLLEDGLEFEQITPVRPVDTQDLEGRKLTDGEVASSYHVPPELVGARQGTFSNIAAFRQMLFGPTLGPVLGRIEDAFNFRIVPENAGTETGLYAEFNREAAMAGSFAEQAEVLSKSVGGPWMTRNEARALRNMPALEDGDELIVPKNVSEGGLASPADTDGADAPEWGG